MKRHRKKVGKLRGHRTHGAGFSKRRRGKGTRMTHHRTWTTNIAHVRKYEPERLSQRGFYSLLRPGRAINLDEVDKLAGDAAEIDVAACGYAKVLGAGSLSRPLVVKAKAFSKKAREKIEKRGGKAVTG